MPLFGRVFHFMGTVWLFTCNDLKTMVVPSTTFALCTGTALILSSDSDHDVARIASHHVQRIPAILSWTWINLLAFAVANQCTSASIEEDRLNKPWRPIPSGRIAPAAARRLSYFTYPIAVLTSCALGGLIPCLLLLFFGSWYNGLGGANGHWLIRNALNACGFTSFAAGALEVGIGSLGTPHRGPVALWLCIVGAIVLTTVHLQDMYDQAGDAAVGRRTIPLVIGDGVARWTIAVAVLIWTAIGPVFWRVSLIGQLTVGLPGIGVAVRTLLCRSVQYDRTTFKLYNVWLMSLYTLPLMQTH